MNASNSLLCFIAGAVAGAATAILLAPDSGENTRAKIRTKTEELRGKTKRRIKEGLDMAEEILEEE